MDRFVRPATNAADEALRIRRAIVHVVERQAEPDFMLVASDSCVESASQLSLLLAVSASRLARL